MRISSSRCTTITNGKITSSIQRPMPISAPIPIVQLLPSPPPPPAPSSASSCTSSSLESVLSSEPITIRKHYHAEKQKTRCAESTYCFILHRSNDLVIRVNCVIVDVGRFETSTVICACMQMCVHSIAIAANCNSSRTQI